MKIALKREPGSPSGLPHGMTTTGAFTLLELIVVVGLVAALSLSLLGKLGGGQSASLQSAQVIMANLVTAARTHAMSTGRSCRILIHVDATAASIPSRYLHYLAMQMQTTIGWETITDVFLPEGVYVVPGNFSSLPAGLFNPENAAQWLKADSSALRSTALRSNQISTETIGGATAEQWVAIAISANAGTVQSGDLILALGRRRAPATYAPGESPVELLNPENVRGLTLSAYAVPVLVNSRLSF